MGVRKIKLILMSCFVERKREERNKHIETNACT
jgi:hypothetical protein